MTDDQSSTETPGHALTLRMHRAIVAMESAERLVQIHIDSCCGRRDRDYPCDIRDELASARQQLQTWLAAAAGRGLDLWVERSADV